MCRLARLTLLVAAALTASLTAWAQDVTMLVLPFQTDAGQDAEIGKKVGVILNLQIWKTLRIPPSGPGRSTKGLLQWDITSKPPTTYAEADRIARQIAPDAQMILWGRSWRYGTGYVVQPYLSIRNSAANDHVGKAIWKVSLDSATAFAVDIPRWQVEFAPIVLRSDIMPELSDPAGLKLYASATGNDVLGPVGDYFRALEQNANTAKVAVKDGTQGWIRLPDLSKNPSEVVNFCGAMIRILRQDWAGAQDLFRQVLANPHTPAAVRVDTDLYLATIADKTGADPYDWIRQAYGLNPYSKTTILYLCMNHIAALSRLQGPDRQGAAGQQRVSALADIVDRNRSLFAQNDPWLAKLTHYLANTK